MIIEFGPDKDRINQKRHGIGLGFAEQLDWDFALTWVDTRFHYDEIRFSGLVPVGRQVFYVAYTECGDNCLRIISLRRAETKEVRYYASQV